MGSRFLKEPPPTRSGRYERKPPDDHMRFVRRLRAHQSEWLMFRDCGTAASASRVANWIKTGRYLAFRVGCYDAVTRGGEVWAVYLGE